MTFFLLCKTYKILTSKSKEQVCIVSACVRLCVHVCMVGCWHISTIWRKKEIITRPGEGPGSARYWWRRTPYSELHDKVKKWYTHTTLYHYLLQGQSSHRSFLIWRFCLGLSVGSSPPQIAHWAGGICFHPLQWLLLLLAFMVVHFHTSWNSTDVSEHKADPTIHEHPWHIFFYDMYPHIRASVHCNNRTV